MKLARLRGRKTCERVLRRGQVWKGKHMKVTYMQCENAALFVGTIVSSKLEKSAVKRNRMRRRCREALRVTTQQLAVGSWPVATQVLLSPRATSLTCDFEELLQDTKNFLQHIDR